MGRIITIKQDGTAIAYSDNNAVNWTTVSLGASQFSTFNTFSNPIAYGNGKYVIVGPGKALVSTSGITWTITSSLPWTGNPHLVWSGTAFVLISDGVTYTSTNGVAWTTVDSTISSYFSTVYGISCFQGKIIVVGNSNSGASPANSPRSAVSTDNGTTWTIGTIFSDANDQFRSACWVSDKFIGFCQDSNYTTPGAVFVCHSVDGLTWTRFTYPLDQTGSNFLDNGYGILSNNEGTSILYGGFTDSVDHVYIIPSGLNWQQQSLTGSGNWRDGFWTGQSFILSSPGSANIARLFFNGTTLTSVSIIGGYPIGYGWFAGPASLSKNKLIPEQPAILPGPVSVTKLLGIISTRVLGKRASVFTSSLLSAGRSLSNYTTWIAESLISRYPVVAGITAISASILQSSYRIIGAGISNMGWHVSILINSTRSLSQKIKRFWGRPWAMLYEFGKWVGIKANSNVAASSPDGATWTRRSLSEKLLWNGIASNGTIIISMATGSSLANKSTDGITWTPSVMPVARVWQSIVSNGTKFVAVALNSDKCITTTDGIAWTEYSMPALANWTSVAWNGTVFCAVSDSNLAATSPDGITWTAQTMPDDIQYNCITWHLGQFTAVASGPTDKAAKSTDGITWQRVTMPAIADWTSVGPGLGDPNA